MYSSTHSGRIRRYLPSLSERSSPLAMRAFVLYRPKPSISATWAVVYHFGVDVELLLIPASGVVVREPGPTCDTTQVRASACAGGHQGGPTAGSFLARTSE